MGSATVSGTLRKYPELIEAAIQEFRENKWQVKSPASGIIRSEIDGFAAMKGDLVERIHWIADSSLPTVFRLIENGHLRAIKESDVNWLVLPDGYLGISGAVEIGWSLAQGVPLYCSQRDWLAAKEPIIKAYVEPVPSVSYLVKNVAVQRQMPNPAGVKILEQVVKQSAPQDGRLNASIAVGPVYTYREEGKEPLLLLVETYKWGDRLSIPGERIAKGEKIDEGVLRAGFEQTGLRGKLGSNLCTFNEAPGAGYYIPGTNRIFADFEIALDERPANIVLDSRASRAVLMPISEALALPESQLEPNARKPIAALRYVA